MIKNIFLGGTALMSAGIISTPGITGSIGSKDAMNVSLSGEMRFNLGFYDQDVSAVVGRAYSFIVDKSELKIDARNTADIGITYGVRIELNAATADNAGADEAYAFLRNEWGRIELGDRDDASDRMALHGY